MGLLDDAIREHLELKRAHGADPEEVERQEREALGAARGGEFAASGDRETPEPATAERPAEPDAAGPAAYAAEEPEDAPAAYAAGAVAPEEEPRDDATRVHERLDDGTGVEEPREEVAPPPEPAVPPPGEEAAAPGYDEDPWLEDERDEVPPDESLERPAAEGEGEDVLEETPDFLQETPEHDRLWFEQRPPRDFDWDK